VSSLRIGVDGDALRTPLSGVGKYVFNLCRELEVLLPGACFIAYSRLPAKAILLPSPQWLLRSEPVAAFRRLPSFVWFKTRGRAMCVSDGVEVFWAGRTLHPKLGNGVRTVGTVHDLNHLVMPNTMQFQTRWSNRLWFRGDILSADCVLANSYGTADRVRTLIGAEVTDVVLPGVTSHFRPPPSTRELEIPGDLSRLGVKLPYLLSVATPEPRKNLNAVLSAYIDLKRDGRLAKHQLVLAGPRGWKNRALEQRLSEASAFGVVLAGYVPDELMPMLYAGADALVFPSLYEGFGIPVLEARACGARVVTTDSTELREAGDKHVIYIQPTVEGIKAGILQAISLPKPPPAVGRTWNEGARILARALCERQVSKPIPSRLAVRLRPKVS
jgi:glycosyltransferase involved in cell wall biosynthesis